MADSSEILRAATGNSAALSQRALHSSCMPPELDRDAISDFLGDQISHKGWSVRQFAHRSGDAISEGTAKNMMKGASITLENVDAALATLGLSWYDLLDATVGQRNAIAAPPAEEDAPSAVDFTRTVARLVEQHDRQIRSMDSEISGLREEKSRASKQFAQFLGRVFVLAGVGPVDAHKIIKDITKEMGGDAEELGGIASQSIQRNAR